MRQLVWGFDLEPMIHDADTRLADMVQDGILGSGDDAWFALPEFGPGSYALEGAGGIFLAWNEPYLCVALEDQAQLSETGEFIRSRAKLTLDTEPRLQACDLSIHLGWDGAGERAGGMEAGFLVDTQPGGARTNQIS